MRKIIPYVLVLSLGIPACDDFSSKYEEKCGVVRRENKNGRVEIINNNTRITYIDYTDNGEILDYVVHGNMQQPVLAGTTYTEGRVMTTEARKADAKQEAAKGNMTPFYVQGYDNTRQKFEECKE